MKICLDARTILEGFDSLEAKEIARKQLIRSASHPLERSGEVFTFFSWAFVINLGIMGLVYCPEQSREGNRQRGTWQLIRERVFVGVGRTPKEEPRHDIDSFEQILGKPRFGDC